MRVARCCAGLVTLLVAVIGTYAIHEPNSEMAMNQIGAYGMPSADAAAMGVYSNGLDVANVGADGEKPSAQQLLGNIGTALQHATAPAAHVNSDKGSVLAEVDAKVTSEVVQSIMGASKNQQGSEGHHHSRRHSSGVRQRNHRSGSSRNRRHRGDDDRESRRSPARFREVRDDDRDMEGMRHVTTEELHDQWRDWARKYWKPRSAYEHYYSHPRFREMYFPPAGAAQKETAESPKDEQHGKSGAGGGMDMNSGEEQEDEDDEEEEEEEQQHRSSKPSALNYRDPYNNDRFRDMFLPSNQRGGGNSPSQGWGVTQVQEAEQGLQVGPAASQVAPQQQSNMFSTVNPFFQPPAGSHAAQQPQQQQQPQMQFREQFAPQQQQMQQVQQVQYAQQFQPQQQQQQQQQYPQFRQQFQQQPNQQALQVSAQGQNMPFYAPASFPPPAPNQVPTASQSVFGVYPTQGALLQPTAQGSVPTSEMRFASRANSFPFSFIEVDSRQLTDVVHPHVHELASKTGPTPLLKQHFEPFPLIEKSV